MLPVGITLQNQAQLQLKRKIYIPRLGWNCASKLNTVTTISSFLTTTLELELRYKIKHGYNKWYKKLLSWIVGIALQNQAQLQPIKECHKSTESWNCASKLSTVTTMMVLFVELRVLELHSKIKHGYNS